MKSDVPLLQFLKLNQINKLHPYSCQEISITHGDKRVNLHVHAVTTAAIPYSLYY